MDRVKQEHTKQTWLFKWLALLTCAISACTSQKSDTLFELQKGTGIDFINEVQDTKEENCFQYRNYYNGGGVATGDLNNDGLADIVFTSNLGSNKIYINKGNFKFEDITDKAGLQQDGQWSTGVSLVDINNDGFLDIYICSAGHVGKNIRRNRLYINNGNKDAPAFKESAATYGLDIKGYCTQAAFFDYDLDGDLDCFLINNTPIPFGTLNFAGMRDSSEAAWNVPEQYKGGANHLYQNNKGRFTEVTKGAGLHTSVLSFGLGVSVTDINNDGYPDVYVGNDFLERDYLYINQKNGTFKDELEDWFQHISMSSMGTDIADINNDGNPDIYTTDMFPDNDYRLKTTGTIDNFDLYRSKIKAGFYHQYVRNCLQLNNGKGNFIDIANYSGVAATDWSWGLVLFDADNDGYNDIYVCNGINRDLSNLDFLDFFSGDFYNSMLQANRRDDVADSLLRRIPRTPLINKVYRNNGDLTFNETAAVWGLDQPSFSNTVAYADLDNDGDLDLVVNNENQQAFVYKNKSRELTASNYISVTAKGDSSNPFAIGTKVKVFGNGQVMTRELQPVRGFQSCVEYKINIGLGRMAPDSMVITWPDLTQTSIQHPAINKHYNIIKETGSVAWQQITEDTSHEALVWIASNFDKHTEDDYVDFYYERNIPRMMSREGPKATVADVNSDGLDDIYIGGAAGQAGQLYIQQQNGSFIIKHQVVFDQFAASEDVAVLFFDADNDGDKDLFIGPGGNTQPVASREMQLRLYKNDGKGNFTLDVAAFPVNAANIAIAVPGDIDHDGDVDLFVGGRSVVRLYGASPKSYLFMNDGTGHFKDAAATMNPAITEIGMVTGAVFADTNGDGNDELVICGEWMAPQIFEYKSGKYNQLKSNLDEMNGWWQTVAADDLDGDGKTDLVFGNIGDNFYLRPTKESPVKLWINDFDNNGNIEKILTRTISGKDMPVFLKHEMEEQIPSLKKQSLHHSDYALKTMQDLFNENVIRSSLVKSFSYTSSCIAFNNDDGSFRIEKLPVSLQMSSVNAIRLVDINGDGAKDIIAGGNLVHFLPLFGRLDASFGNVLLNDGKGHFSDKNKYQKDLQVKGEVKDIAIGIANGKRFIMFLRNDDFPVLYQVSDSKAISIK